MKKSDIAEIADSYNSYVAKNVENAESFRASLDALYAMPVNEKFELLQADAAMREHVATIIYMVVYRKYFDISAFTCVAKDLSHKYFAGNLLVCCKIFNAVYETLAGRLSLIVNNDAEIESEINALVNHDSVDDIRDAVLDALRSGNHDLAESIYRIAFWYSGTRIVDDIAFQALYRAKPLSDKQIWVIANKFFSSWIKYHFDPNRATVEQLPALLDEIKIFSKNWQSVPAIGMDASGVQVEIECAILDAEKAANN